MGTDLRTVKANWTLIAATLSQATVTIMQQGVAVLGLFFVVWFHMSLSTMGSLVSAVSLGYAAGFLVVGRVVDLAGPRILFGLGSPVTAVLCFLVPEMRSTDSLMLLLLTIGFSLAVLSVAGTKAVYVAFAGASKGLPVGIRQTGVPLGAAMASLALPMLAEIVHESLFQDIGLVILIAGWVLAFLSPRLPQQDWQHRAAVMHVAVRVSAPMLTSFMLVAGQYIVLTFSIPYLHQVDALTITRAGELLAVGQVGGMVGRIGFGYVSDRVHGQYPRIVLISIAAAVLGSAFLAVMPWSRDVWMLLAVWFGLGIGTTGWNALSAAWAGSRVPIRDSGFAMSLTSTAALIGSALYPPVFGWIAQGAGYRLPFGLLAGYLVLAGLIIQYIGRHEVRSDQAVVHSHSQANNP